MLRITFMLILFSFLSLGKENKSNHIPVSHPFLRYEGRTIAKNKEMIFAYSGCSIELMITGKKFKLCLKDEGGGGEQHTNYLNIEINGQVDSVLSLNQSKTWYDLSNLLHKDTNVIKVIKRTEAMVGSVILYGFQTQTTQELLPLKKKSSKILWIGDSFMCGYGNEVAIAPPPEGNPLTGFHAINENSYLSWSSITSRQLNANSQQVCYSGKGVYRNIDDSKNETIPKIFDYSVPSSNYSEVHNHKNFIPDLIISALGTNDFGPEMTDPSNLLDSVNFVTTYSRFLNRLSELYPHSKIVIVVGSALTDFWPKGLFRLTRSRNYIKACKENVKNKAAFSVFELSTQRAPYGEDWHPSLASHRKMSGEILPFIKNLMNW